MKDPAVLWYPNDYIGGTMGMTFEQKGAYVELLMTQFNRGHMTSHMIGQVLGQDGGRIWDTIKDKFIQDEEGMYYNVRFEKEQIKRKMFIDSRKNNLSGNNQYSKKVGHKGGRMTSRMENENINKDLVLIESIISDLKIENRFSEILILWLDYKRKKKQTYKTVESTKTMVKHLLELSGNNFETAKKIIETSIACNYAGLFPVNGKKNGKQYNDIVPGDPRYVSNFDCIDEIKL